MPAFLFRHLLCFCAIMQCSVLGSLWLPTSTALQCLATVLSREDTACQQRVGRIVLSPYCIYVCICKFICVYVHLHIHRYRYTYIYILACIYYYLYRCIYISIYRYIYVYIHIYACKKCLYMYIYIYIYVQTCIHIQTSVSAYVYMYIRILSLFVFVNTYSRHRYMEAASAVNCLGGRSAVALMCEMEDGWVTFGNSMRIKV